MKKLICLALALIMIALPLTSCGDSTPSKDTDKEADESTTDVFPYKETKEVTNLVIIDVKNYGKIVVELYPDKAPITVENFKKLVSEEFYDGLVFHRVIKGFMIQGGGFDKKHREHDAESIKGEFSSNGVENDLLHTRGVISMARTYVPDSASCQFNAGNWM